jgi:hypothetical protein
MERTENDSPAQKTRFKSEFIVALAAIVVSVMTLFVYIYQARIMMDQQHTSVWPYVAWNFSFFDEGKTQELYISVVNKGVGPALVKDVQLTLDGTPYFPTKYDELLKELFGQTRRDSLWIIYENVSNIVMAPGDEVKLFYVKSWQGAQIPEVEWQRFKASLCYCSVYDDCWTTDGKDVKAGRCK